MGYSTTTKPGDKYRSLKRPDVYEALRRQGYSKERAARISNSMAKRGKEMAKRAADLLLLSQVPTGAQDAGGVFTVFKDDNGEWRWLARSSNAYRDRDGEIVSTKALENDVEFADKTKDYGPLRFWHMPGVDVGVADFNMLHGRTLIESGTFKTKALGDKIARKADQYQVSIGFRHPPTEPDRDGVFHTIRRFERSLVPAGRAANPFTSFSVYKEKVMGNNQAKLAALKTLLDDDEVLVQQVLNGAQQSEKQADALGISFKEANAMHPVDLLEFAVQQYEAWEAGEKAKKQKPPVVEVDIEDEDEEEEEEAAAKAKKRRPPFVEVDVEDDEEEEEEKGRSRKAGDKNPYEETLTEMKGMMTEMKGMMAEMRSGSSTKDASWAEATTAQAQRLKALEEREGELAQQLKEARQTLAELRSEQPRGLTGGYRPSRSADTLTGSEVAQKARAENPPAQAQENGQVVNEGFMSFVDFIVPGGDGAPKPPGTAG